MMMRRQIAVHHKNRRHPMTTPRYPHPDLSSLPEDIRARILEVQEKAGFIPNVFPGICAPSGRVAGLLRIPRCPHAQRRRQPDEG